MEILFFYDQTIQTHCCAIYWQYYIKIFSSLSLCYAFKLNMLFILKRNYLATHWLTSFFRLCVRRVNTIYSLQQKFTQVWRNELKFYYVLLLSFFTFRSNALLKLVNIIHTLILSHLFSSLNCLLLKLLTCNSFILSIIHQQISYFAIYISFQGFYLYTFCCVILGRK